jgi:hypothetical protein
LVGNPAALEREAEYDGQMIRLQYLLLLVIVRGQRSKKACLEGVAIDTIACGSSRDQDGPFSFPPCSRRVNR